MKIIVKKGRTSLLVRVFIQDSSSTTGAGLTGLTNASSGLVCYRARDDDGNAGATQLSLSAGTRGTWSSGGFVEKDSTNMPGVYELGLPDAGQATGSETCTYMLKGATNMAPCVLEVQLVAFDPQDSVRLALTALPNASAGASGGVIINGSNAGSITLADVTINGTAASGATPAKNALTLTGGAASTTGGGTAGVGLSVTGGAGAGSTNGAASGATIAGGGTNTVASIADGLTITGTSNGNGMTLTHAGTGKDFNATTTPLTLAKTTNITGFNDITVSNIWQDTTAGDFTTSASIGKSIMNGVALGTGLTINAYTGNTPQTGDCFARLGAPAGASIAADLAEIEAETDGIAAIPTSNPSAAIIASAVWQDTTAGDFTVAASVGKSVMNGVALGTGLTINAYTGNTPQTGDSYARLGAPAGASIAADLAEIEAETDGIAAIPTSNPSAASIATAVWQDTTAGDFTVASSIGKSLYTSGNAPGAASGLALVGSNMGTVSSVIGSVNSVTTGVTVTTNNDKTGYSLTQAFPINFSSLSITAAGLVSETSNKKKGVALSNYGFIMLDSSTGAPKTGLTVRAQVAQDGGAFAASSNAPTEVSLGWYQINLTAAEMNGNLIKLQFIATGSSGTNLEIITQP